MSNKVEFGIRKLFFGIYEVASDGTVTMGAPYHVPGARKFAPSVSEEESSIDADNITYWSEFSGGTHEGDVEVVLFPDQFKTQFLGDVRTAKGGLGTVKHPKKPNVYMGYEVDGDAESRRVIYYNGTLGSIKREHATHESGKRTPETESINAKFIGDPTSELTRAVYKPGDAGYDDFFTNPPLPELAEDEGSTP